MRTGWEIDGEPNKRTKFTETLKHISQAPEGFVDLLFFQVIRDGLLDEKAPPDFLKEVLDKSDRVGDSRTQDQEEESRLRSTLQSKLLSFVLSLHAERKMYRAQAQLVLTKLFRRGDSSGWKQAFRSAKRKDALAGFFVDMLLLRYHAKEHAKERGGGQAKGALEVRIIRGEKLKNLEVEPECSDPFVTVVVGGGTQKAKTDVVNNDLSPEFQNGKFIFMVSVGDKVEFTCRDFDISGEHGRMGSTEYTFDGRDGDRVRKKLTLKERGEDVGYLHVVFTFAMPGEQPLDFADSERQPGDQPFAGFDLYEDKERETTTLKQLGRSAPTMSASAPQPSSAGAGTKPAPQGSQSPSPGPTAQVAVASAPQPEGAGAGEGDAVPSADSSSPHPTAEN